MGTVIQRDGKQFSLKKQFYTTCFLLIMCILSTVFLEILIENAHSDFDHASAERFSANQLASEFERTIDDLHKMVQGYVTFGDNAFAAKFNEIKLIVNGTNPRPQNYNELYRNSPPDYGFEQLEIDPSKSLLFHIKNSGVSEENLAIILNATDDYAALILLQEEIIKTVSINPKQSVDLLASVNYKTLRKNVLNSVINFINFLEQNHHQVTDEINERQKEYEDIQKVLIFLTSLFIITVIVLVNKFIVNPITHISEQLKSISLEKGDTSEKNMKELIDLTHSVIDELKHKTDEQILSDEKNLKLENSLLDAQRIGGLGHWNWNVSDNSVYWSEQLYKLYNYELGKVDPSYENFRKILHPDDTQILDAATEKALKDGKPFQVEHRLLLLNGEIRNVIQRAEVVKNDDNTILSINGTLQDITDIKKAEEAAVASENRMLEAQKMGRLGSWNWDIKKDIAYLTEEACRIYNQPPKKGYISLSELLDIIHPDDKEKTEKAVNATLEKNKPYKLEHRIVHQNGDILTVITQGELKRDDEGNPISMNGTALDITDLKKAEEIARDAEANLVKIFDVAPAAIITTNHKMEINIFNQSAVKIFGYQQEEIIGEHINILIPHEYRSSHHEKIDEFNNSGGQSRYMNERTGIKGLKKDGTTFPAAASVSNTGEGNNKIYTIILLDTTERMLIEKERVVALTEAQEANQAKSRFLATMSHELRTPLNAIIGFSEMMTHKIFGDLGSSRYEEYAHDIVGSSKHLLSLVNDILDLSEIESGKKNMDIAHILLRDTVDECQVIITKLAEDKNIKTIYDIPDDIAPIFADHLSLKQIIINILNNALKFTQPGGLIELNAMIEDDKHVITISDNGEGIPASKVKDVLTPFSRVDDDPYKTQEGKGLGLAIVKSLMALHNGTIKIESEYGIGTKVILRFPMKEIN